MGEKASSIEELARKVRAGERRALGRAITLVESRREDHRAEAAALMEKLRPDAGKAVRIGMTGSPGAGKSTLIDTFGTNLTAAGHKVAVLAVDPTSTRTGGSILGDKTRMAQLSQDEKAFIRPSPTGGTLGGVAARTREAMLVLEAAGFDVIIVETVGVGQSETAVADMVDVFVALSLPGSGDELQGLKKGVLELADIICVNKAEAGNLKRAEDAAADLRAALRILASEREGWSVPVLLTSGLANEGLQALWQAIGAFRALAQERGSLEARRRRQAVIWFRAILQERLTERLFHGPAKAKIARLEKAVEAGETSASAAAEEALAAALGAALG
ncbi:methylmalonyl Co-A mutase-associated GTPase MeaB [Afifella pfennigii]|uniref:methylmalonyl Co-A mutase-associated GTPase MeaB n=1 Tax=Afifella pfennigii TaxID=209897 RepID=UPI00047DE84C|nr:methylmalonyl Co-A mutase-associated GTPase MeaB [Afifella pfennigii]